jgi:SulP family sulfate permease
MTPWARWFPFLRWPRPELNTVRGEFSAGLTVSMLVIPQSMAYAAVAGMPLITGVYAAFLPALVALLWGASPRLSVGPTALTSLLVMASLSGLAPPASAQWVTLAVWLALLSGLLQLVLGLARCGWILNLVSSPVLTGFTQAAALLIIGAQLPALVGVAGPWHWGQGIPDLNLQSTAFGLASLAFIYFGSRLAPKAPTLMIAMVAAGSISYASDFSARGGAVIGALPSGFPSFYWPTLPTLQTLGNLILPAMVIALVSFIETAASAKVENQRAKAVWDGDQDLIAQGLAKITAGLIGCFPTSASFSRSAVNLYAGAKTGWATLVTIATVMVVLLWLTPALYHLPSAALAGVVVAAVMGLLHPWRLVRVGRIFPVEAVTMAVTFGVTLVAAPHVYWGILAGVMLGLIDFLHQRLHPRIVEVGLHPDGSLRDRYLWQLPCLAPHLYALRLDAALDFAAASSFERSIYDFLLHHPDTKHVCLFAHPINRVDATGVEVFASTYALLSGRGITLHLSGMKLPVETVLRRAGLLPDEPYLKVYRSDAQALAQLSMLAASAWTAAEPAQTPATGKDEGW